MMRLREHLSYANVISTIALFAVLGGGAYAAGKIGPGAVTAAKIAEGVLGGPAPPTGAAGGDLTGSYPNPAIAAGAVRAGQLGAGSVNATKLALIVEESEPVSIPNGGMNTVAAFCPAGTQVISGGGTTSSFEMSLSTTRRNAANNGWTVAARNATGSPQDLTAYAYCLDGPN